MFVLGSRISIGDKKFNRVHSVEIESDRNKLEDRATIKIPTTALLDRQDFVTEVETAKAFNTGDEVRIELGYDGNFREEFRGFVRKIHPKSPVVIECEDEMYLLKRKNLKAAFKNTTLSEILEFIVADTGVEIAENAPEIKFSAFYFRDVSAAKALEKLRSEYGLRIYFTEWMILNVGFTESNDGTVVKYRMGVNVIDSNLEYVEEEDVKLEIKAINIRSDNTRVEKKVGDADGEKRTLFFYDLNDESSLEQRAKEEIKKYKYAGYRGHLRSFLLPNAIVGNVARLEDPNFSGRDGDYLIEKITTSYGSGGGRRKIELGIKVSV